MLPFGFSLDLKKLLNDAQYQAATYLGGPLLIVAGAGTGKTRTLVHRVAWLVDQGLEPSSILLLTFTRKAANEMLKRCAELAGDRASEVSGGTFHAIAHLLLRKWAPTIGFTNRFAILDQDDAEILVGKIRALEVGDAGSGFPKRGTIFNVISQSANKDMDIASTIKSSFQHLDDFVKPISRIAEAYKEYKIENDQMDFDDLLINLEKLLRENEDVRRVIAGQYAHILVDEYQDTNAAQARLTHLLGRDHLNVTAVGDEAQSIYAFRGANFRNIMDFPAIFPGAKILKLEENYRSCPQILDVANKLIKIAKDKFEKTLRANRPAGSPPAVYSVLDPRAEAETVANLILADLNKGIPLSDMAVLFRAAAHSFELETVLTKLGVPFSKFGGRKFLEMAHTKDFICYLRLVVNPRDEQSLRRVLSHQPGLGPKGVESTIEFAFSKLNYDHLLPETPRLTARARQSLTALSRLLVQVHSAEWEDEIAGQVELVQKFYAELLPILYPDDYPSRASDINEAAAMAAEAADLVQFLAELALDPPNTVSSGPEEGRGRNDLTLSTVHSAKGLEWGRVYIISAVDGRFPSAYSRGDKDIEEELRLMYVAVTRARERLLLFMPINTPGSYEPNEPSRFLSFLKEGDAQLFVDGKESRDFGFFSSNARREARIWPSETERFLRSVAPNFPASSPFAAPASKPSKAHPLMADKKPAKKKAAAAEPSETLLHPQKGQRIKHSVFGHGVVLYVDGPHVFIDFDQTGKKKLTYQYAKLVLAND
ncbi:MAG: ATP-dependent helicase [Deltaproteobacteria bacterium]|jgi:DNA helicase-2/ATP-dependent DNA helicase PcrA|nr:ATP-dependent helicase [Deltaproteobacteria bacterium]